MRSARPSRRPLQRDLHERREQPLPAVGREVFLLEALELRLVVVLVDLALRGLHVPSCGGGAFGSAGAVAVAATLTGSGTGLGSAGASAAGALAPVEPGAADAEAAGACDEASFLSQPSRVATARDTARIERLISHL